MLYKFRHNSLVIVLTFFTIIAYGKEISFQKIEAYNLKNTFHVKKDSKGFLWISSTGLSRYDGYEIKNYNKSKANPDYYKKYDSHHILEDSHNNLWFACEEGIAKYVRKQDRFIYYDSIQIEGVNYKSYLSYSILKDKEGNIYASTANKLNRYNTDKNVFEEILTINPTENQPEIIRTMILDDKGVIWMGTRMGNIYCYNLLNKTKRRYKEGFFNDRKHLKEGIFELFRDSKNKIWVVGPDMVLYINPQTGQQKNITDKIEGAKFATCIDEDPEGNIWIGAKGISIYNPNTEEVEVHFPKNIDTHEVQEYFFRGIYNDGSGIMWVYGWNNLIFHNFNHLPFRNIQQTNKQTNKALSNNVNAIFEDISGTIWIGSTATKGNLQSYNPQSGKFNSYPINRGKQDSDILCITQGRDEENLLVGYHSGLFNFNIRSKHFSQLLDDTYGVYDLQRINHEKLWIAGNYDIPGGFAILNLSDYSLESRSPYSKDHFMYDLLNVTKIIDGGDNIWLCSWKDLYAYNKSERTSKIYQYKNDNPNSLSKGFIYNGLCDSKNRVWITSTSGISLYNPEDDDFINFGEEQGLKNQEVRSILEDKKGNLWLGTYSGISQFRLPAMVHTIKKDMKYLDSIPEDFMYFRNFNEEDGIKNSQFTEAALRAQDGTMYFGGINGITYFKPEEIVLNQKHEPLHFVDFKLFNQTVFPRSENHPTSPLIKEISCSKQISLTHEQNIFSFSWAALNYTAQNKIEYAYQMLGFEKGWNYVGNQRTATYTNLPPGTYTFRVKATNNAGIWNTNETSIQVHILPPWYKTIWFRTVSILLIISLLLGIYWYRIKTMRLQQIVLEKKVQRRTVELEKQKEEILEQNRHIKTISQKLEETSKEKLRIFTNISHEFRTPITIILGHLNMIKGNENKRPASIIKNNSFRLLDLVDQLIEIRKADRGEQELKVSRFNIASFTQKIVEAFKALAIDKSIELTFSAENPKLNVWLDQDKLQKILYNLISNAVKYTPENNNIDVKISENDKHFILSVKDTGIGIREDEQKHIFEQFYRSSNTNESGHGIGLTYTKILTEVMKGDIRVESTLNKGTCFTITFLKGNEHFDKEEIEKDSTTSDIRDIEVIDNTLPAMTIPTEAKLLLVEDNLDLRNYLCELLRGKFIIEIAPNGKEALDILLNYTPDLIISDLMMPVMDGLSLFEKIKNNISYSHIPFILLTAKTDADTKIEGFTLGIDDFIEKPFDNRVLIARITALINNRKQAQLTLRKIDTRKNIDEIALTPKDKAFLNNINELLETHYSNPDFDTDKLCELMKMGKGSFIQKFKHLTSFTIGEHIRKYRLYKAAELIRTNRSGISEACFAVGFNSISRFRINFKKEFGITPSEYVMK